MNLDRLFQALVVRGGVLATVGLAGCPEPAAESDSPVETDTDTDTDADSDTDTDADSDTDAADCSAAECLNVDDPITCSSNGVTCCWAVEACCDFCCE